MNDSQIFQGVPVNAFHTYFTAAEIETFLSGLDIMREKEKAAKNHPEVYRLNNLIMVLQSQLIRAKNR